jgi:hypothetical protein
LQTGAAWRFLPDKYPSPATCWRRLKLWEEQDVWLDAWRALLGALDGEGLLQWEETFLDGSFAPAKKGAPQSVKPRRSKRQKRSSQSTFASNSVGAQPRALFAHHACVLLIPRSALVSSAPH